MTLVVSEDLWPTDENLQYFGTHIKLRQPSRKMYLMEHFKHNINVCIMTKILQYNVKNVSKFPFVCSERENKSENTWIIS